MADFSLLMLYLAALAANPRCVVLFVTVSGTDNTLVIMWRRGVVVITTAHLHFVAPWCSGYHYCTTSFFGAVL